MHLRAPRSRKSPATSFAAAVSLVTAAVLLLTGCQTAQSHGTTTNEAVAELPPLTELTPIDDPTAWEGPSTALIGEASLPTIADRPTQQLPATVVSHDFTGDTEVVVDDASRVLAISISGTIAELVYAFGLADNLVGRDVSTQLPGYEDLPVVTKQGHSIDAEGVLALAPTLILTDGSIGPADVVLQLRDAGIQVVTVTRATTPDQTYELAGEVAGALGVPELAAELVDQLSSAIAAKEAEIATLLPSDPALRPRIAFLYVRGTAGIYYLFGEGSGADYLIEPIGAVDVADEIGWVGEKPMTDEALIALDPDIILVMTKGLESAGGVDGLIAAQPSIALTNAGKHRRIIDVADTFVLSGGTRFPDVIDGLARAVYAPDSLTGIA